MIAIDANILIRYIVRDNLEQTPIADDLLEGLTLENPGFVCREVVMETAWVLERTYRFPRDEIADALIDLFATGTLIPEAADDVTRSIDAYSRGRADLADLLILAAAKRVGAAPLYTFDRKLSRMDGAALLGA